MRDKTFVKMDELPPLPEWLRFKPQKDMTAREFSEILSALNLVVKGELLKNVDRKLLRHFEEKKIDQAS